MKKNHIVCNISLIVLFLVFCCFGGCGKKAQAPGNALVNTVDEDKDGYYGSFDLRIDANGQTEFDTLDVKAKIVSPETEDTSATFKALVPLPCFASW